MDRTNIEEDPDMIHNYQKEVLKDRRPDAPLFEEDQKRMYYGDHIKLRLYGARSDKQPYLEDGTFLDHIFLEPDSRSIIL